MKKFFIVAALCLVSSLSFGQERVNREQARFSKNSQIISKASGWAYNDAKGKWIKHQNIIAYHHDLPFGKGNYSNFNTIQIKSVFYDSVEYFCLIVNKWYGRYMYPEISYEWREDKIIAFYIMTLSEYQKLFSLTNTIDVIEGFADYKFLTDGLTNAEFALSIIKQHRKYEHSHIPLLKIYKATDGNIRFLFNEGEKGYYRYSHWNENIDDQYFEVTEKEWEKLKLNK